MSTVRLEDVSKVFKRSALSGRPRSSRSVVGSQVDRAFAERVAADPVAQKSGPVTALDHVDLTIPDGETFAIVGPSGCGKSTLLRVVAGLESDYTGHIYYDDVDMKDVPPKDRFIGMVFQNYALYPHFEGEGNLAFFFRVRKAPDAEAQERIRVTSEMMGIGFKELLNRKPGKLSGGQQQRVAIARALVRNPRLFLFDEPLSNLDAKLRTQTRVEIKRLLRRFEITAIYVTHDQVEAISLGDKIAVMREGRIEQVGTYQALRQTPINAFVAGFVGHPPMNLITGGCVEDGLLCLSDVSIPIPVPVLQSVRTGQAVTLGIRPEKAHVLTDVEVPVGGTRLRGVVEVVEPDFAHHVQRVYVRTNDFAYLASASMSPSIVLNVGDRVEVVFPDEELYFFDTETEERLG